MLVHRPYDVSGAFRIDRCWLEIACAWWRNNGIFVIETAKENGLLPYHYLKYLFEQLPQLEGPLTPEQLEAFLPWSSTLLPNCRLNSMWCTHSIAQTCPHHQVWAIWRSLQIHNNPKVKCFRIAPDKDIAQKRLWAAFLYKFTHWEAESVFRGQPTIYPRCRLSTFACIRYQYHAYLCTTLITFGMK